MSKKAIALNQYRISIRKRKGVITKVFDAENATDATARAEQYGQVLKVVPLKKGLLNILARPNKPMSETDRFKFFRTLSNFLVGYSLDRSLTLMSENFANPIRRVCLQLKEGVQTKDLADAMEDIGIADFPPMTVAVIRANSQVDTLSNALLEGMSFERRLLEIQQQESNGLMAATAYFLAAIIGMIATEYSFPMLEGINYFDLIPETGKARDLLTSVVWLSSTFFTAALWMLMFWVALMINLSLVKSWIPEIVDNVVLKIPVLRGAMLARHNFLGCYQLSKLISKGIKIDSALKQVESTVPRGALKDDFNRVVDLLTNGSPEWAMGFESFSDLDRALLLSSSDKEGVGEVFRAQADQFIAEYKDSLQYISYIYYTFAGVFGIVIVYILAMLMFIPSIGGFEMVDNI
jgi:type II secretory pathway component PulF